MPLLALPALSQADTSQAPSPDPANTPAAVALPPAPAPKPPTGPPNLAKMSPKQIADLAAYNIALANLAVTHYTYKETEHNQNYIDGKLVVDHTTVTENIFINNLPYTRKLMVDGQPLEGKELKAEQKLYDQAIKDRRALDAAGRAAIEKHALRSTSPNIDRLSTLFVLKLDGHQTIDGEDCVILDAMPQPDNTNPDLAQHIRIALEADTGDVLDVNVEFLEDDNGFSKGSVLHTRYKIVGANPLPDFQNWDTVVRFKELLGKAITIHRERTFSDYKRFRATVTIKSFAITDKDTTGPDAPGTPAPASTDGATALPAAAGATPPPTPEEKAKLKADAKAKSEADAKAKADAKAEAKAKAKADAEAKARADADAKAQAKIKAEEDAAARAAAKAQADAEAKTKAEAAAQADADARAEARARADAEAKAKAEERAQAKAAADAKAKADAEEKAEAKAKIAALAKADAEEKAKLKADLARSTAEQKAKIKAQTDAVAKEEADTRAKLKDQSKEQAKLDTAVKAKAKADADAAANAPATSAPATTTDTPK